MHKTLAAIATIAALGVTPLTASAQVCTAATAMTSSRGYLSCAGSFTGNLNGSSAELTQLSTLFGGAWTYRGKTDDASFGPFATGVSGTSGTATFDALVRGRFVIGVKASTGYSFYLFDGGTAGLLSVPFETIGTATNPRGIPQDVSHLSLYTGPATVVPEPSTLALMGTGLVGLVGVARRRRTMA